MTAFNDKIEINRVLKTNNPETNLKLWKYADYEYIPNINQLVTDLANYEISK